MADEIDPPVIDGAITAPVIYFEAIQTLGSNNGIISLMLVTSIVHPGKEAKTMSKPLVVAHLRCSVQSAVHMRDSIDRALLLGIPTEGKAN